MGLKVLETADQMIIHIFRMKSTVLALCRESQDAPETFSKSTVHVIHVDPGKLL